MDHTFFSKELIVEGPAFHILLINSLYKVILVHIPQELRAMCVTTCFGLVWFIVRIHQTSSLQAEMIYKQIWNIGI